MERAATHTVKWALTADLAFVSVGGRTVIHVAASVLETLKFDFCLFDGTVAKMIGTGEDTVDDIPSIRVMSEIHQEVAGQTDGDVVKSTICKRCQNAGDVKQDYVANGLILLHFGIGDINAGESHFVHHTSVFWGCW